MVIYKKYAEVAEWQLLQCLSLPGHGSSIDFLHDAKHLSVVEKSAFTDILGKAAWSHT